MSKYRIIEITGSCIGGESEIYITTAPDQEIESAINEFIENNNAAPFEQLSKNFEIKMLISTQETLFYDEMKQKFEIGKTYEMY